MAKLMHEKVMLDVIVMIGDENHVKERKYEKLEKYLYISNFFYKKKRLLCINF